jgi:hypothetical protein
MILHEMVDQKIGMVKLPVASWILAEPWTRVVLEHREVLGGEVVTMLMGGAPMPVEVILDSRSRSVLAVLFPPLTAGKYGPKRDLKHMV